MPLPDATPDPAAVLAAFGRTGDVVALDPVAGAWSNRVWRLEATTGVLAVKQFRDAWDAGTWRGWTDQAWPLELAAQDAGVAMPRPVPARDGGWLAEVPGWPDHGEPVPVRVHEWVTGRIPEAGDLHNDTDSHTDRLADIGIGGDRIADTGSDPDRDGTTGGGVAAWVGATLATVHRLARQPTDTDPFPRPAEVDLDRWTTLAAEARRQLAPWARKMAAGTSTVEATAALVHEGLRRSESTVLCHGDVTAKNLLLTATGPRLCDWDLACPLVPRHELATVAVGLATLAGGTAATTTATAAGSGRNETGDPGRAVARAVVRGYTRGGGSIDGFWPTDLATGLRVGLDWLVFCVERALGLRPAAPDEVTRSASGVHALLDELPIRLALANRLDEILLG